MSTFLQSQKLFNQTHFTVVEIDLPSVAGACTISGAPGFGTPLSCDQSSDGITTYKFTQDSAPLLPESGILGIITSITETPAKLNSGRGLSSRATGSIRMFDVFGKDPNPNAPGVTDTVKKQGGWLAKLAVRNELSNKPLRIKNYRLEVDGTIDLENGAQTKHFIIDSMNPGRNGEWSIKFKDELSRINIDETLWPIPLEGFLLNNITDTQTSFNVDPNVTYLVNDTIRCGDELMKITGLSGIGTGSASITVQARGTQISYTNLLSQTTKSNHNAGDEIFVCEVSDNETIDSLLARILIDIGIDASYIPAADWLAEIALWHPSTRVNVIWIESQDTFKSLEMILTDYMIDMWFDPVARLIKISAISVWQSSSTSLIEGNQIDFGTISKKKEEQLRATRAYVIYDKPFLASNNSIENYKRSSIFVKSQLESADVFGEPKTKNLGKSILLDNDSGGLLANRYANRFSNPFSFVWKTQERKLTFSTGDVVGVQDLTTVNFAGLPDSIERAQITSIKTNYTTFGRDYSITALSYEPNQLTGTEIVITENRSEINLYNQYAGAPSAAVQLTFIFDATLVGSTNKSIPAIKAGAFAAGSKIIIIMVNGADLGAYSGAGGEGESLFYEFESSTWIRSGLTNGENAGVVYDAEGIDTDIYFSGSTPSSIYPTADGYIKAPSGGDGGFQGSIASNFFASAGDGGNSGDGRISGERGLGGVVTRASVIDRGDNGQSGTPDGLLSGFGQDGANNNALGGAKGKGIVDNGATVTLFGATPARYINGGGDHV